MDGHSLERTMSNGLHGHEPDCVSFDAWLPPWLPELSRRGKHAGLCDYVSGCELVGVGKLTLMSRPP